jgi:hypothetical protein
MKYCKTCHVHYDTTLNHCILCNGDLEQVGEQESTFKYSEMKKKSTSRFFLRLIIFIIIVISIISIYLDYQDDKNLDWSLVVTITSLYLISIRRAIFVSTIWTSKFIKSSLLSIIAFVFIGLCIGSYGWAIEYVLPFAIITNVFIITLLTLINKNKWYDYFSSLIIIVLIGLIPGLFILLNVVTVVWPSFVCFSYSLFSLLGIILLPSKSSREEFKRRFHI